MRALWTIVIFVFVSLICLSYFIPVINAVVLLLLIFGLGTGGVLIVLRSIDRNNRWALAFGAILIVFAVALLARFLGLI